MIRKASYGSETIVCTDRGTDTHADSSYPCLCFKEYKNSPFEKLSIICLKEFGQLFITNFYQSYKLKNNKCLGPETIMSTE